MFTKGGEKLENCACATTIWATVFEPCSLKHTGYKHTGKSEASIFLQKCVRELAVSHFGASSRYTAAKVLLCMH